MKDEYEKSRLSNEFDKMAFEKKSEELKCYYDTEYWFDITDVNEGFVNRNIIFKGN